MGEPPILAGRYQILGVLGRGGMGEVFLAHDLRLDVDVAIKRVPPEVANDPLLKLALTKEARIMARLNDPHIVRLFDLSDTPDGLLLVLEYVCGPSLSQILRTRKLTETELIHLMRDVSAGLTVAHQNGVIHRDLKPPNLLLALPQAARMAFVADRTLPADILDMQAKVTDFGIAKLLETSSNSTIFSTAGSPGYMAPEQYLGELASPETDVYALGIIAYEALSGRPPFTTGNLAHQHLSVSPGPIGGCSPRIEAAIMRALAKGREQRYPTAAAFFEALRGAGPATATTPLDRGTEAKLKPWRPGWRGALPLVLVVVTLMVLWLGRDRSGGLTTDGAGGIPVPSEANQSQLASLGPAPYASGVPPMVEESRDPKVAEPSDIRGPRHGTVAWKARVRIPETDNLRVVGVGPEGMVYLLGDDRQGGVLCALKDGRLAWGYSYVPRAYFPRPGDFDLAPDGRVWMIDIGGDDAARFCFNSHGQGGRVPASAAGWKRVRSNYESTIRGDYLKHQITGVGYGCQPDQQLNLVADRPGLRGRPWSGGEPWLLPLDQPCPSETRPLVGPNGDVYFQTISKLLYRVSPEGRLRFTYPAPCMAKKLYPLTTGEVLFFCGKDLYRVRDGTLQWKVSWREFNTRLLIDRDGTVYAMEEFNAGFLNQPTSHLIAIAATGERLWELALDKFKAVDLFLDAGGRLYVTGAVGDGNGKWGIFCLQ